MAFAAIALVAATSAAPLAARPGVPSPIVRSLADKERPATQVAADRTRKPAETLAFAGVRPGMVIGEFYPGGGYFTRLLARVVGPAGHVYAIENDKWKSSARDDAAMAVQYPNVTLKVAPFGTVDFPQPLDLAWVTQNYHDLKIAQYGAVDTLAFDRAVFASLKPGGVFLVIDHEAPSGTDDAAIARLHRIEKATVIREVTAAGFRLAAEGSFLRQASDDRTLPIFDKAVQGRTDQYALKFVKPR